ncbi:hypothetical protein [Nocardia xishanensis]|uniref:hypothetical protein n=1 Tax=Nocardia xishanensis TaxID=238964 RepID=UPI000831A412|nr:hypothetical protein [Nocardia xishanensis]
MPDQSYPPYPASGPEQYREGTHFGSEPSPGAHPGYPPSALDGYDWPRMPSTVRAAQIIAWSLGALGVAIVGAVAALSGDAERAGAVGFGFGLPFVLAGLAFSFDKGDNGLRITAIVLAALQGLCGLGATATGQAPGLLVIIAGIAIVCLLAPRTARDWFTRPRLQLGGRQP